MAQPDNIRQLLGRLEEEGRFAVVLWGRWDEEGNKVADDLGEDDFGIDATRNMSPDDVRRCIVGTSMAVDADLGVVVRKFLLERESKRLTLEDKLNQVMGCVVQMDREAILVSWPVDLPAGNGHGALDAGLRINTTSKIEDDEAVTVLLRMAAAINRKLRPIIKAVLDELR